MNAKQAWAVIGAWVLLWNASASGDRRMLSEQMDVWRRKYPWLVFPGILVVSAHLLRLLPGRFDPITASFGYAHRGIDSLRGHHG